MKLVALVFALMTAAVVAVAATYVLSASPADAAQDLSIKPVWRQVVAFPHDPFEGIQASPGTSE